MLRSIKKLTGALCLFACATATLMPTAVSAGAGDEPILHIIDADKKSKDATSSAAKSKKVASVNRKAAARRSVSAQQKYTKLIRKAAAKHGVPVKIAKAVVEVESNFNARARGRAGEVGLMQIKPATARGLGYRGSTKALYKPETNLEWGMKYLAGAHKRANGDLCGTILRYNAGHYARSMNPVSRRYCTKVKRILASS
ncbi:transglycosylase SLT domain-containing protein [Roseibium sp. AS2]|uniref:lytic transglycosylase domain-containing protein n=2 Tax=unclassified Roseibium TaxID=2629323 RepID=UPI0031722150